MFEISVEAQAFYSCWDSDVIKQISDFIFRS